MLKIKTFHKFLKRINDKTQKTSRIAQKLKIKLQTRYEQQFFSFLGTFIILLFIIPLGKGQDYSTNYIINGNFSSPQVVGRGQYFNLSIQGWECTKQCEIKDCILGRKNWLPQHKLDGDCIGQVIDLNSNFFNQVVSQEMNLSAGRYILHFNYYYPVSSANIKMMQVTFNEETILYVHPQVAASFNVFQFQSIVQAVQGQSKLSFSNHGYLADGLGFKINNVSLYRINDRTLERFLQQVASEGSIANSLPGGRAIFRSALSFLVNFDRLQLYVYHSRTFSQNAQRLLVAINNFLAVKSNLAVNTIRFIQSSAAENEKKLLNSANYKGNYISYPSFSSDYQNTSYLDTLNQSFVYFFPFVLIFIIIMNMLFRILFHKPISLFFRKFSLWAIVLIMMFDGNIQEITFFTLGEFKIFFSNCFYHKTLNIFIIFFFFLLIFTVFGLLPWGKFHYKKKIRYLIDEKLSKNQVIWGIVVDRGIICFLFGCIHELFIDMPYLQLIILALLEVAWITKKCIFISKDYYEEKWLVCISICSSICRIFFQVSCYLYQIYPNERIYINQVIHGYLIYAIIGCCLFQMAFGIICCLKCVIKTCKVGGNNKIIDSFNHQNNLQQINMSKNIPEKKYRIEEKTVFNLPVRHASNARNDDDMKIYMKHFQSKSIFHKTPHKPRAIPKNNILSIRLKFV